MADFNFTVDTGPMAERIRSVTHSVEAVGGAVTAMQVAVVASERMATDKICQSIDGGFYMLLRSKLSQRIAEFTSTMSSRTGSMMETASAIDRTHQQMVGDFNRIKSRYVKIFDGLNHSLEKRIRELDREAMSLARVRASFLNERQCRDVPAVLYGSTENTAVALRASNALMKTRAQDSIGQLGVGMRQVMDYRRMTQGMLEGARPNAGANEVPYELVPVTCVVAENLSSPQAFALEVTPPSCLEPREQAAIAQGVRRRQDSLRDSDANELQSVRAAFMRKVTTSGMDERVAQTMTRLFDTSFGWSGGAQ